MLKNMMVGQEPISGTLAWASDNGVEDYHQMAIHCLQTYEDRWETWVTPKPYEKIIKALEEASG